MLQINAETTKKMLNWPDLIEALRFQFKQGCVAPTRHHHGFNVKNEDQATLLLMPAWIENKYLGVKLVSVIPGNTNRQLPAVNGAYILSSAKTGENLAFIDGSELTARRTAAASALAADYLANKQASKLLLVGAGKLSLNLIEAHATVRNITMVEVWARRESQSAAIVQRAKDLGFNAKISTNLEKSAKQADIISCATLAKIPIISGSWLKKGAHLDLVGAFTPNMRESDDECVRRARIFVDTKDGAMLEAGDITQPLKQKIITEKQIIADLYQLTNGSNIGRETVDEITMFKSVGAALEDLAAAILTYENFTKHNDNQV